MLETTSIIRDERGKPQRLAGIVQEITERKQAEMERERLLAEFEATLNAMINAVVIYGHDGEIRLLNPAAERIFGYSPEMKARPLRERKESLHPESPDGGPFPLERLPAVRALAGEIVLSEIMALHPAGSSRPLWVTVSAAPIRTPDGRILGAVSTMTDITSLHELQKEREMVIHTISHDLRTPLTLVQGHAELLGTACRDENSLAHLEAIRISAERMNAMIEELVDAARLEGGKVHLTTEPVFLDQFLGDLLQRASSALETARIIVEVPPELPPVAADPNRLERILNNLLTNALKYSPDDSPVAVRAQRSGEEVVISVQDRGQGIHPEDQLHIFDRFYRPRSGRKADSVGLGLYITRVLVEAHGGRIRVESEPGVGSTFFFTLPVWGNSEIASSEVAS